MTALVTHRPIQQLAALKAVADHHARHGHAPSIRDVAAVLGIVPVWARHHLRELHAAGLVCRPNNRARCTVITAAGVLTLAGWLPGPPPGVLEEHVGIDKSAAAAMQCGGCKRRGLVFHVMHLPRATGETLYGGYVRCPRCSWQEET